MSTIHVITVRELINWSSGNAPQSENLKSFSNGSLVLPPIQRSVVWDNKRIIDFWDSLLRGYPFGMMMIHKANKIVRSLDGNTHESAKNDWALFDGQQRLSAILLGFGIEPLSRGLKLWVDFSEQKQKGDTLFNIRLSSSGQPFGYQLSNPNQKFELSKRKEKRKLLKDKSIHELFKEISGIDLIEGNTETIPFANIACKLLNNHRDHPFKEKKYESFVNKLNMVLDYEFSLMEIDSDIVNNPEDYLRVFSRIGQNGIPLSNDELTYSIIKNKYPFVHDVVQKIKQEKGRFISEIDLVMAALRVARVTADKDNNELKNKYGHGRPTPEFAKGLSKYPAIEAKFKEFIPEAQEKIADSLLFKALDLINLTLSYDKDNNQIGFPRIAMSMIKPELMDILILFANDLSETPHESIREWMIPFALHSILFTNLSKASYNLFQAFSEENHNSIDCSFIKERIAIFENEGISYTIPRIEMLDALKKDNFFGKSISNPSKDRLAFYNEKYAHNPSDGLRKFIFWDQNATKFALLWLQRDYISKKYPDYDPTSEREDDLPIDLDHLIPQSKFSGHFKSFKSQRIHESVKYNTEIMNKFSSQRNPVGNSIGNLRWLDSSENRARQDGEIDINGDLENDFCLINATEWNGFISNEVWNKRAINEFETLIECRSVYLYEQLLNKSLINDFLLPLNEIQPGSDT
ncbi:MAG: DUF262 domain-containing protein [Candidatus Symbiobacter sp.]|nr:DUF262 domain-containing protein [Candidatus Symbiobacter sp.]